MDENNYEIPIYVINLYKNKFFKLFYLFTLYFYCDCYPELTLFLAFIWVYLNKKINEQELTELYS